MDKFRNKYRIPSARLPNWDYGWNGSYFITICTANRECFFGNILNGEMQLSEIGELANKFWLEIPEHFPFVKLDVQQQKPQPKNKFGPQSENLASIIRGYKTGITKYARNNNIYFGWQSRFHDHIIRNNAEYQRIKNYIINNPRNWNDDSLNS